MDSQDPERLSYQIDLLADEEPPAPDRTIVPKAKRTEQDNVAAETFLANVNLTTERWEKLRVMLAQCFAERVASFRRSGTPDGFVSEADAQNREQKAWARGYQKARNRYEREGQPTCA